MTHHPFGATRALRRVAVLAVTAAASVGLLVTGGAPAQSASSSSCEGGGFSLVNKSTGAVVTTGDVERSVAASALGAQFVVRGRYIEYTVRASDFAVLDYAFTGAANPKDITGGVRTPVFASKVPGHRGLALSSAVQVSRRAEVLVITRTGTGLSMKIQSKDCAQGGIFQMEPERGDRTRTRVVHTLAASTAAMTPFYFDNANFRANIGKYLGSTCSSVVTGPPDRFCVQVSARTNIANGFSEDFVARDSAQVAERVPQADCNRARALTPSLEHCGRVSVWDIASGGRMGFVTGEDAVEVANPPTDCVQDCQAQNQVRGRLVELGFPFPVPAGDRLTPATSSRPLPPLTTP